MPYRKLLTKATYEELIELNELCIEENMNSKDFRYECFIKLDYRNKMKYSINVYKVTKEKDVVLHRTLEGDNLSEIKTVFTAFSVGILL